METESPLLLKPHFSYQPPADPLPFPKSHPLEAATRVHEAVPLDSDPSNGLHPTLCLSPHLQRDFPFPPWQGGAWAGGGLGLIWDKVVREWRSDIPLPFPLPPNPSISLRSPIYTPYSLVWVLIRHLAVR